jgi:hypothetical protein
MGPPSTSASRERGRDLGVEKKCIVAVRRTVLLAPLTRFSYFVRSYLGQQRTPQPLALLQDSYRKIDDLNGLRPVGIRRHEDAGEKGE